MNSYIQELAAFLEEQGEEEPHPENKKKLLSSAWHLRDMNHRLSTIRSNAAKRISMKRFHDE